MSEPEIEGLLIEPLKFFRDQRGWLAELFRNDELGDHEQPVMAYCSMTLPGESRGPHEHREQTDRFAAWGPSDFRFYVWDNRKNSPTFNTHVRFEVGQSNPSIVVIPAGVVHGYVNIGSVEGVLFNAPDRLYRGQEKKEEVDEIRHEDDPDSPYNFLL